MCFTVPFKVGSMLFSPPPEKKCFDVAQKLKRHDVRADLRKLP
jgi:hypothetical protein